MEDQLIRDLLERELQFITDQQKRKHTAREEGDTDPVATIFGLMTNSAVVGRRSSGSRWRRRAP
jgi:hypothetical protein